MAFGTTDTTDRVMNEINVTPLVDVMLVLLIILYRHHPRLSTHAIKVQLLQETNTPVQTPPPDPAPLQSRLMVNTHIKSALTTKPACKPCFKPKNKNNHSLNCTSWVTKRCATKKSQL